MSTDTLRLVTFAVLVFAVLVGVLTDRMQSERIDLMQERIEQMEAQP